MQHGEFVVGNFADDANGKARAGEGLAIDNLFGQAKFEAHAAHFVFEQVAQRLNKLEFHMLRQAADVVVGLYLGGYAACGGFALDYIGIQRALR